MDHFGLFMKSRISLELGFILLSFAPPVSAAAPIYFDLGWLIFFGVFLVVLFVMLLVKAIVAKSKIVRAFAIIGLLGYVVVPGLYSHESHRIRAKGQPWAIFTSEEQGRFKVIWPTFDSLCQKAEALSSRSVIDVTGFRILDVKPLNYLNAQARGWDSAIEFYAAGTMESSGSTLLSIVGNLKSNLPRYMKKGFVEYRNKDGGWERFGFGGDVLAEKGVATIALASHGVVFEQIYTGYEEKYYVFYVSIRVYDLRTGELVARNDGLVHDAYFGAHNYYQLISDSGGDNYCRRRSAEFVADWLSSLSG